MKKYCMFISHKWENGYVPFELPDNENDWNECIIDHVMDTFGLDEDDRDEVSIDMKWGEIKTSETGDISFTIFKF